MSARYLIGDVRDVMATLPDGSVDLVFTSPPFLRLRSYLDADDPRKALEIGQEPDPPTFVDTLLDLAGEWRRLLAPHGSIGVEIGDTYAGSGGAGGDYDDDGLRAGQNRFAGSARERDRNGVGDDYRPGRPRSGAERSDDEARRGVDARNRGNTSTGTPSGGAWPLDKSLCGIPAALELSLAYGVNVLNGRPSPAGRWRVRNRVAWCRPNPPVGDVGDKYRVGTSYIVCATLARDRWFDLDAVRVPGSPNTNPRTAKGVVRPAGDGKYADDDRTGGNRSTLDIQHASTTAPPLDWWEIPPGGYKGAHYAVFPPALVERPVESMCPRRVCRTCGAPSRRVVYTANAVGQAVGRNSWADDDTRAMMHSGSFAVDANDPSVPDHAERVTVGWSTCGCPGTGDLWADGADQVAAEIDQAKRAARRRDTPKAERRRIRDEVLPPLYTRLADHYLGRLDGFHPGDGWRPGHVLDPFAGSGTTLAVAVGHGRNATGIDIDARNADLARERVGMFLTINDRIEATA